MTTTAPAVGDVITVDLADTLMAIESTMQSHLDALVARKAALAVQQQQQKQQQLTPDIRQSTAAGPGSVRRQSSRRREGNVSAGGALEKEKMPVLPPNAESSTTMAVSLAPTRSDKVAIRVRIVFLKVGEIDTMRDRFAADVFVQAKWREPTMDYCLQLQKNPELIDWTRYWDPNLIIENVYGDPRETKWRTVEFDRDRRATVCERRRVNGAFLEYMELNRFPFDMQDLTVSLSTDRDENEIEFVEDSAEPCAVNVETFVDEQEWKLYRYMAVWTKISQDSMKSNTRRHPMFSAACKASRRSGFFIWNILVVMCLICSMSFCTFSVKSTLPQNRLQLSFILLLTNVSFKFVVNQSLPMISYLTILDKYILGSMGILCIVCVWHAMIAKMIYECLSNGKTEAMCTTYTGPITTSDNAALAVLCVVYVIFHIVFIIVITSLLKEHAQYAKCRSKHSTWTGSFEDNGMIPDLYSQRNSGNGSTGGDQSVFPASQHNVISAS